MKNFFPAFLFLLVFCVPAFAQTRLLSDFQPGGLQWVRDSGLSLSYVPEGLRATISFSDVKGLARLNIDAACKLDLSRENLFRLETSITNTGAFSDVSLYFHSGKGWFGCRISAPGKDGVVKFTKGDFKPEDEPGDWDQIDGIRISFWRLGVADSEVVFHSLKCVTEPILFASAKTPNGIESWFGINNTEIIQRHFAEMNIGSERVALAHDATEAEWLEVLKNRQACIVNFTRFLKPETREFLKKWSRENLKPVFFIEGDLREEPLEMGTLMETLAGSEQLRETIETQSLSYLETVMGEQIPEMAQAKEQAKAIFKTQGVKAGFEFCEKTHAENLNKASLDLKIADSFEFRGWWNHDGLGAYPGDWARTARELKAAGFNAVVPNMLWVGEALFPSRYAPVSENYRKYGDQLAQCLEACHAQGIQVHIWRVCFRGNWHISDAKRAELTKSGRFQRGPNGEVVEWICPSDPENIALEVNTMLEMADKYPIDGVHFDYIRYDGVHGCFCDGCRERFEKSLGRKVENWPEDVMQDGKLWSEYSDWRAGLITNIVKTVHDEMKVRHPNVKISAAVFNTYPHCKEVYGQDWVKWANEGFVDFLCPMNYTQKTGTFEKMTKNQQALVRPDFPLYFGIGEYKLTADGTLDQVKSAKKLGGKGFTIYNLEPSAARKILPPLTK